MNNNDETLDMDAKQVKLLFKRRRKNMKLLTFLFQFTFNYNSDTHKNCLHNNEIEVVLHGKA